VASDININLRNIIEDLERYSEKLSMDVLSQDLKSIIGEMLSYLSKNIDINRLESRLAVISSIDMASLKTLIEEARKIVTNSSSIQLTNRVIDPNQAIVELERFVSELEVKAPLLKSEDVVLQIDFVGNHILDEILLCAVNSNVPVTEIKKMVVDKLKAVPEDVINAIWNMIVGEFDTSRPTQSMPINTAIMSEEFLQKEDINRSIEKIAEYMVELKPRLIVSMFDDNIYQYPANVPGCVRVIASIKAELVLSIADWEVMLGNSISRLACIWQNTLYEGITTIARILGISKDGRLLSGPDFQEAAKRLPTDKTKILSLLFLDLRRILNITKPIEKSLWQYKLGLEVMTPEIIEEIKGKSELLLQKELCKFLVERDIFAVGTKFGRSQTDILAEDSTLSYIIETKIYRQQDTLNEKSLRKNISQLHGYMDQYPKECKGVLAVYNMTDWLLETPRRWLHQKFWILPINLQLKPPSGLRKTAMVEESGEENLISVVRNVS
jgi:hypothetical protein